MPPDSGNIPGERAIAKRDRLTIPLLLALFGFLFLYIDLRVDTTLLYVSGPGLFVPDLAFLRHFLDYPGKADRYLTLFLQELYWVPHLGALVASGLIVLLSVLTRAVFGRIVRDRESLAFTVGGWLAILVPALLALVAFERYRPVDLVGIDVALLLGLVYSKLFPSRTVIRIAAFAVLLAVTMFLSPNLSPLLASLCAIWEIAGKKRPITGLLYAVAGALPAALVNGYAFHRGAGFELSRAVPIVFPRPVVLPLVILGLLLVSAGYAAARRRSRAALFASALVVLTGLQWRFTASLEDLLCFSALLLPTIPWLVGEAFEPKEWRPGRAAVPAALAAVVGAFLLAVLLSFAPQERDYLELKRSSDHRDWAGVLAVAKRLRPPTWAEHPSAYCMVHRALFHTGRLPWDLLNYPVLLFHMQPVPMPTPRTGQRVDSGEIAEMCLDLGLVNYAELLAYDALDRVEPSAHAYELLVLVYLAKGNPAAARPFLHQLEKTITHRKWAAHYLALANGTADVGTDRRIEEIRANMIRNDRPEDARVLIGLLNSNWDWAPVYERLLRANRSNRMAFEYLMSYYLLLDEPGKIAANIPRMWKLGYPDIPSLYQEAILLHSYLAGKAVDGEVLKYINPSLADEYKFLVGRYFELGRDAGATSRAVDEQYGRTYFSYCMWFMYDAQNRASNN